MRNEKDFNKFYKTKDPWGVSTNKNSRNFILKKIFKKYIKKSDNVLELGCGEGNFSKYINKIGCNSIGIDISGIAIERAKKLKLSNYKFERKELLDLKFNCDIILAIEVIYYLNDEERTEFFKKLQNKNIKLILSTPIIGKNQYRKYFTDNEIKKIISNFKFKLIEEKKLNFNGGIRFIGRIFFNRFMCESHLSSLVLQILPNKYIYQKVYVVECGLNN